MTWGKYCWQFELNVFEPLLLLKKYIIKCVCFAKYTCFIVCKLPALVHILENKCASFSHHFYWAGVQQNVQVGTCAHRRLRSACAAAQSDQSL